MPPRSLAGLVSRRFIRLGMTFGVGVGVGLAPLLGTANVPGFRALLALFPPNLADTLIPLSAFMLGLVALSAHAVLLTGALEPAATRRTLFASLGATGIVLVLLVITYSSVVVRVPYDGTKSALHCRRQPHTELRLQA